MIYNPQGEAYTLRLLLMFIAKDLGIDDDKSFSKHKLNLVREIRSKIQELKDNQNA